MCSLIRKESIWYTELDTQKQHFSTFFLPRQRSRVWNRSLLRVCLCVCQRSPGWTVGHTDSKFGWGIDHDNISYKFEGQGHGSKVKVARLKNVIFGFSDRLTWAGSLCHMTLCGVTSWRHVTSRCDVILSCDVTERRHVTSWHPLTTFGQEYWQRGHVAGGHVNAQAFFQTVLDRSNHHKNC